MAHNIEERNGVYSFAENGSKQRAWHGLGQVFDRPMFVEEALKACHADYEVQMQPVAALTPEIINAIAEEKTINAEDLLKLILPNAKATMRMDNKETLGLVSDTYGIVQNKQAFEFIDTLCSGKETNRVDTPVIECAGVLGKGERVFITCKMATDIILNEKTDDRIERYLVFTTSHDGSGAVRCVCSPVRVVCQNTLSLALQQNSGRIAFRHTSNVMNRLDLMNAENAKFAFRSLNLMDEYTNHFKAELDHLRNIRISEKQLDSIIAEVVLSDEANKIFKETHNINHEDIATRGRNIFIGMKDAIESGIGQDILESGNALWAINGVTTYYQNNANFKNDEAKFTSIFDGNVQKKVQKAYELLSVAA